MVGLPGAAVVLVRWAGVVGEGTRVIGKARICELSVSSRCSGRRDGRCRARMV